VKKSNTSAPSSAGAAARDHAVRHVAGSTAQAAPGQGSDTRPSADWLDEPTLPAKPEPGARIDGDGKQAPATPAVESRQGSYK
jgi:hypothetical protein